jgi:hypothetical protein
MAISSGAPARLYRGDGWQFCIVMPEQDAVVAITSGGRDMQAVMTWCGGTASGDEGSAIASRSPDEKLNKKLAGPAPASRGQATSPRAATISGSATPCEQLPSDEAVALTGNNGATVKLTPRGESRIG